MTEREAFEQWAASEGFCIHRDETEKYSDYHRATTRWAWQAWQARAAVLADRASRSPVVGAPELPYALMEACRIPAVDEYFHARQQIDSRDRRKVYEAGYAKGWDDYKTQRAPASPTAAGPMTEEQKLWCVHVWGPDDVYAEPSKAAALEHANALNIAFGKQPRHEYDPIVLAVVVEWPHDAESHASDMKRRGIGVSPTGSAQENLSHENPPAQA